MQTAYEFELKLAAPESRLQALTEQVRRNDEQLRCPQRSELQLLHAPDFDGLLLTTDLDRSPGLVFVDTLIGLTARYATLVRPWLGSFSACDHGLVIARADVALYAAKAAGRDRVVVEAA